MLVQLLDIYVYIVLASVIISWLTAFGVLNMGNAWVYKAVMFIESLVQPVYAPIRRVIPAIGGLDLSPLVLLIGITILQSVLLGMV